MPQTKLYSKWSPHSIPSTMFFLVLVFNIIKQRGVNPPKLLQHACISQPVTQKATVVLR